LEFIVLSFPFRGGAQVVQSDFGDMPPAIKVVKSTTQNPQLSLGTGFYPSDDT
jgi:hypothetical protein